MHREFASSDWVSLLRGQNAGAAQNSRQDTAERLSQWMGAFDAVNLRSMHASIRTLQPTPVQLDVAAFASVEQDVDSTRAALVQAIAAFGVATGAAPLPDDASLASDGKKRASELFALCRQRYLDQQRELAHQVAALRARVRQSVARGSVQLRQLAALDAVWEQMLGSREQKLLAQLPTWLKQRLLALPSQTDSAEDGASALLRETLLAELNLRLQPVAGQLAAFKREVHAQS